MKLICPDCGKQYESGKFCLECGAKLQEVAPELVCPSCGYNAKAGKFCPECGTKLTEQGAVSSVESNKEPEVRQFNEKDERFAKYYDKKGFPRTLPQEERSVAIEELKPFAEQDIAEAKMLLGGILMNDSNIDNVIKGASLLKEADQTGDKFAYYFLGLGYYYGWEPIVEQDHNEAEKRMLELYKEYNNGDAAQLLALLYTFSQEKCDYKKAFEYAIIAAEDDEKDGYAVLGALYLNGWGVERNIELALENYKMAAALGDETSMNQIGFIFMGSDDYEANPEQSFYWFNEAAKKGSDVGMSNLAYCYRNGFGVKQDEEIAAEWYKKAAELGYVNAMYELGAYYQNVLIDSDKAKMWYQKAAELGHAEAINCLGVIYSDIEEDYEEAVKCYERAVELEVPMAYRNLALCYRDGKGIEQDLKKATELLKKASKLGVEDADQILLDMDEATAQDQEFKKEESQSVSPNEWYVPEGTTVLHETTLPNTSRKWRDTIEVIHLPKGLNEIDIVIEDETDPDCSMGLSIFPNLSKVIIPTGEIERFSEMDPWFIYEWHTVWYDGGTHISPEVLPVIDIIDKPYCVTPYDSTIVTDRIVGSASNIIISPKCVKIEDGAFLFDKNLESVYMLDSVKLVGKEAFRGCKRLNNVRISKNVVTLQKNLFNGCDSLKEIVVPEGVSVIEEAVFASCKSLETIVLPSTIIRIDNGGTWGLNPFSLCKSLRRIIVPKGTIEHFQNLLSGFSGNPAQYLVEA